jgi:hypothetical protein
VLDLSRRLIDISIDPARRIARVGGGVQAQALAAAAARHGLAPVLGECATVGAAGVTLGGGLGWLSGKFGASCDNLLSAGLITSDGRAVTSSAVSHTDLFWAIRGGGGNFGVVTQLEYRLQTVGEVVAGGFAYPLPMARSVLRFYREFMAEAPDELQAIAYLSPTAGGMVNVVMVCLDGGTAERTAARFRSLAMPARDTLRQKSCSETFTATLLPELESTATVPAFPFRIDMGVYLTVLSDEAIEVALERFALAPPGSECRIGFDHYMHGAVCRTPTDATAFELRQPHALHSWVSARWRDRGDANRPMTWAAETWKLLQPFTGERLYSNYTSFEGPSAAQRTFGSNLPRLIAAKKKYDPGNFWKRNQNIQPA